MSWALAAPHATTYTTAVAWLLIAPRLGVYDLERIRTRASCGVPLGDGSGPVRWRLAAGDVGASAGIVW
jgi:hypothetical protein